MGDKRLPLKLYKCILELLFYFLLLLTISPVHGELKIVPYGFVKLDTQYNTKNTGSFPSPKITAIPLDTDLAAQHGQLIIDARHTRIGIRGSDCWKEIRFLGVVEADFYTRGGNALAVNGHFPRIRLGYGKFELTSNFFILCGQYHGLMWNDEIAIPDLIDYSGPVASSDLRQPQLRFGYDHDFCRAGKIRLELDVEKHSLNTLGYVDLRNATDTAQGSGQKLPLFVSKITWEPERFKTEFAGALSKSYVVLDEMGKQIDTIVWGLESASEIAIKPVTLYCRGYYLSGLSRLVRPRFKDCLISEGKLFPVKTIGGYLGARYDLNQFLSINTVASWSESKQISGQWIDGAEIHIARSFYINFLYKFWTRWQTGLEYQYDLLEDFNGKSGSVNILHSALWFYF